jgi:hypothetical protein
VSFQIWRARKCRAHRFPAVAVFGLLVLVPACSGQQEPDPLATLSQTRERLLADLDRMPRYTCVQTIKRTYYDARAGIRGPSCPALIAIRNARNQTLSAFGWDRLRLEVAWVESNNLYAWFGEPKFADDNLEKLAGEGPLGSGDFGVLLREILLQATLDFQREQVINGERLLEYSYDMPLEKSTYKVKTSDGWTPAAYSGTLLLDPKGADVARLTIHTVKVPLSSSTCQATNEIAYARTSIHDRLVLIPREARLDVINASGAESISQTTFTNCREYASSTRLFFPPPKRVAGPHGATQALAPSPAPLPAGLLLDARIITLIDSDTAAAGDPIEAVLRSPIRGKRRVVVAAAGTRIHGRLSDVRWRSKPESHYEISVRFESMEIDGSEVPFSAVLEPTHPQVLTGTMSMPEINPVKPADGFLGGTFSFRQEHLRLKNLDAQWVTVAREVPIQAK